MKSLILAATIAICGAVTLTHAQQGALSAADKQRRIDTENELQSIAIVERKVMMPMPDGVRLATDIYRPTEQVPFPVLLMRSPYGKEDIAIYARTFVQAGYAVVIQEILRDKIYLDASDQVQTRGGPGDVVRRAMMGDISGDLGAGGED